MPVKTGIDLSVILKTAGEIADNSSYHEVTLATLAKKLQIRTPSLYNYIDGLNDLRKKMAVDSLQQLYSKLVYAVMGLSGDKAVETLGEAYVEFARCHPGLYEATFHAPDPKDTEVQQVSSKIVDLVLKVLNVYGLEYEAALHATRGLRSIFHGFASLEQKGGFGIPLDVNTSLKLLINTFLAGMHAEKSASKAYFNFEK